MEPTANTSQSAHTLSLRTLLSIALILLLSLLLSGVFEYLRLQTRATEQAADVSRIFGRSSAILIQPLVLSDDRISLNYLLNELTSQPLINGLRLTAPDKTLIALAGEQHGRTQTLELVQGEVPIGHLTVWSNPTPFRAPLQAQLMETALLLGLCLLISATLVALSLRRTATLRSPPQASFADIQAAIEMPLDSDRIPDFHFDPATVAAPATSSPVPTEPAAPQQTAATGARDTNAATTPPPPAARVFDPWLDEPEPEPEPQPKREPTPAQPPQWHAEEKPVSAPIPDPAFDLDIDTDAARQSHASSTGAARTEPTLDTGELVSLLKPAADAERMPHFTPRAAAEPLDDSSADALVPDFDQIKEDDFALDEQVTASPQDSPRHPNPLQRTDEKQPELYRFEQALEITPDEAGYLLLIDTRSAHSDNVDDDERGQLLRNYLTLANSAARIYNGDMGTLKNGNVRILFTDSDDKDSHGINALCCAMLFTYLYKQYNQQQIRAFKPVMNLHMALVRGALERIDCMQEEAHFLTRTTQSNELISHTALTEATLLKEMLLQPANIRREDEDKVLILSISDSYQALLEKQAHHLLGKLSERDNDSTGA
ncbi:putative membrane protein affecting hemolysin expression [Marinobacterium halophilum]|uniref:Putative membrane protein affecting hemolysin expression n=1 Tax=Marinobacterium halophilum TaxID=267374 RepID=A0A2P8ETD5_9GAMM|nr:hypothetical protein [Marinobacterium halophilum]PSL12714.1 putative membrane protein affecting hemolysin expression [Marinobacterium halophilum]